EARRGARAGARAARVDARRPAPRRNRAARLERRGHAERAAHHAEERVSEDRVWGRNPVLELLRGGGRRVDEVAVLAGGRGPLTEVVALARRVGVKVSYRTREQLTAIAGTDHHQGVVARVAAGEYVEMDALLEIAAERGEAPFLLALDQVQDPRNFGAALGTAEAFGAHGVIVGKQHQGRVTGGADPRAVGAP